MANLPGFSTDPGGAADFFSAMGQAPQLMQAQQLKQQQIQEQQKEFAQKQVDRLASMGTAQPPLVHPPQYAQDVSMA